jgi:prophage regulatory protein
LDRILRLPQVLEVTGLPTSSLYRQMETGSFPRPVRLGKNTVGWRSSAVQAWLDGLEEVKPGEWAESRKQAAARPNRAPASKGRSNDATG